MFKIGPSPFERRIKELSIKSKGVNLQEILARVRGDAPKQPEPPKPAEVQKVEPPSNPVPAPTQPVPVKPVQTATKLPSKPKQQTSTPPKVEASKAPIQKAQIQTPSATPEQENLKPTEEDWNEVWEMLDSDYEIGKNEVPRLKEAFFNSPTADVGLTNLLEIVELIKEKQELEYKDESSRAVPELQPTGGEPELAGGGGIERGGDNRGDDVEPSAARGGANPVFTSRPDITSPGDPSLVPEAYRELLKPGQVDGVAKGIVALDEFDEYMLFDGTGAGKTHQELVLGKILADRKMKVLLLSMAGILKVRSWKKNLFNGESTFAKASEQLDIPIKLLDGPLQEGEISLCTYNYKRLAALLPYVDENTVIIFDEAHNIRNIHMGELSKQSQYGRQLIEKAGKVVYASATPIDSVFHLPYLLKSPAVKELVFPGMEIEEGLAFWGLVRKGNKWVPGKGNDERVAKYLTEAADRLTKAGIQVQRGLSLRNVDIRIKRIPLSPRGNERMANIESQLIGKRVEKISGEIEALRGKIRQIQSPRDSYMKERKELDFKIRNIREQMLAGELSPKEGNPQLENMNARKAELFNKIQEIRLQIELIEDRINSLEVQRKQQLRRRINKGLIMMSQRRAQEEEKIPEALKLAQKELEAGRQLVIFASRVREAKVKSTDTGELVDLAEGTMKLLRDGLQSLGLRPDEIAEIHGGVTDPEEQTASISNFQSGKSRALIGTIESGGTGIDLDDQIGGHPRTMIIVTPPLQGAHCIQAIGRLWRLYTRSFPRVFFLFSDSYVDNQNIGILVSKLRAAGNLVSKEFDKFLEAIDPQFELTKSLSKGQFQIKNLKVGSSPFEKGYGNIFGIKPMFSGNKPPLNSPLLIPRSYSKQRFKYVKQMLRDNFGRIIGEVKPEGGKLVLYDRFGRRFGEYNPELNFTFDMIGMRVGEGNLLTALLGRDLDGGHSRYPYKSLDSEHEYGCLLAPIPDPVRKEITDWILENVPDYHLGKGGRELKPHLTIKYGFEKSDDSTLDKLKQVLGKHGSIEIELGELTLFDPGEDGQPLVSLVDSEKLQTIYEEISDLIPCKDKHYPNYQAHVTLAYLDPEFAHLYVSEGKKSLPEDTQDATPETPKAPEPITHTEPAAPEQATSSQEQSKLEAPQISFGKTPSKPTQVRPSTRTKFDAYGAAAEALKPLDSEEPLVATPVDSEELPIAVLGDSDDAKQRIHEYKFPDVIDWNEVSKDLPYDMYRKLFDLYYDTVYKEERPEGMSYDDVKKQAVEAVRNEYQRMLKEAEAGVEGILAPNKKVFSWDKIAQDLDSKWLSDRIKDKTQKKFGNSRSGNPEVRLFVWSEYQHEMDQIRRRDEKYQKELEPLVDVFLNEDKPFPLSAVEVTSKDQSGKPHVMYDRSQVKHLFKMLGVKAPQAIEIADQIGRHYNGSYSIYEPQIIGSSEGALKELNRWAHAVYNYQGIPHVRTGSTRAPAWEQVLNFLDSFATNLGILDGYDSEKALDEIMDVYTNKGEGAALQLLRRNVVDLLRQRDENEEDKIGLEFDFNKVPFTLDDEESGQPSELLKPPKSYSELGEFIKHINTYLTSKFIKPKLLEYLGMEKIVPRRLTPLGVSDLIHDSFDKFHNVPHISQRIAQNKEIAAKIEYLRSNGEKSYELSREIRDIEAKVTSILDKKFIPASGDPGILQYEAVLDKLNRERHSINEELTRELLKVPNPTQIDFAPSTSYTPTPPVGIAMLAATDWYRDKVEGKIALNHFKVAPDNTFRASFNPQTGTVNVNNLISPAVMIHELGHGLEHNLPGADSAARKFFLYRVKGQKARKFTEVLGDGYAYWEEGMDDDFKKAFDKRGWYVGKAYPAGDTELVSMGVELLYTDPVLFADRDPEYFAFILGILDGSLRDTDNLLKKEKPKEKVPPKKRGKPIKDIRWKYKTKKPKPVEPWRKKR